MKLRPCIANPVISFQQAKEFLPNFVNAEQLSEQTASIDLGTEGPIRQWQTDFLFNYEIFPSSIMRFVTEWQNDGRKIKSGDIILQRAVFPPFGFGVCLEFAVRVTRIIDEKLKLGFAYETLSGHVERGISEFYFEEKEGRVYFTIHTFSEPANKLMRFTKQIFTLPYQRWCTQRALMHVKKKFIVTNKKRG